MKDFNFELLGNYTENIIISSIIFLLILLEIWLINRASSYLKKKVQSINSNFLKIQSFELINLSKQKYILIWIIKINRVIAIFFSINFSILLILSLFPDTESVVNQLIDYILEPLKRNLNSMVDYLPKLFTILIIIFIFHYLIKLIKVLTKQIADGNLKILLINPRTVKTTSKIVVFILFAFMLILIMPLLPGYESLAFKGVATFLGALITIGGSSVIANFMAGIVTSYMKSFQVGDWIKIDNTVGEVIEMGQFAIKIKTAHNTLVSIPHTKGLGSHIVNYSGENEDHIIVLNTTISIGYDVSWSKVNELLLSASSLTEFVNQSKSAFVRQVKLDDFYIVYELNAYTNEVHKMQHIYSELHKHILDVFDEANIEILSPHFEVKRGDDRKVSSK